MTEPISPEKLRGLQQSLDTHGRVRFRNGATVEVVTRYRVTTPLGAKQEFTEAELAAAYELALRGPGSLRQPATEAELEERYGAEAPY